MNHIAPLVSADFATDFLDAMREAGVKMDFNGQHPVADGKLHRASSLATKKRNLNVWYVFHADEPASGAFGDYAMGINETWTAKRPSAMTDEERGALKRRMEDTQRQRTEQLAKVNAEAAEAAQAIWKAAAKASPDHPYLAGKGLPVFPGLKQLGVDVSYQVDGEPKKARAGSLVVPLMRPEGGLASVQLVGADGKKLFLKGTAKAGNYTSVGKLTDELIIGEGYATAARCHMATGLCAIVAFDSGNLLPVAKAIRKKYPDAKITIASDNDRFTKKPDGTPYNPGIDAALAAAKAIGAFLAVPAFYDDDLKSSDFDDMGQSEGLEAVAAALADAKPAAQADLKPVKLRGSMEEPPPYDAIPEGPDGHGEHVVGATSAGGTVGAPLHPLEMFGAPHFRCLGVDGTAFFYQPSDVAQVIQLSAAQHNPNHMMTLAPLSFWEIEFPTKTGVDWNAAVNACIRACKLKRKFSPEKIVGRGIYWHGDQIVAHLGDRLMVDGVTGPLAITGSARVYEEGACIEIGQLQPMDSAEARRLPEFLERLDWTSRGMGKLLAGWLVTAPLCGFLEWRPHVWLTGPFQSGKSFIQKEINARILGQLAVNVQGSTTEAGVRQLLKTDALPVIFDESEPHGDAARGRLDMVLELARQASSNGAAIVKGSAGGKSSTFKIMSTFFFSSIETNIRFAADDSRIIKLAIRGPRANPSADEMAIRAESFALLKAELTEYLTDDFGKRLFLRTLQSAKAIRHNARIFASAIAQRTGDARLGDTIGAPLAGWYSLSSTGKVDLATALRKLEDWRDWIGVALEENVATEESHSAMAYLLAKVIRIDGGVDRTIEELVRQASLEMPGSDGVAFKALGRHGLRVELEDGGLRLLVSNTHHRACELFRETSWSLKTLDGHPAVTAGKKAVRFSGTPTKCRVIDFSALMADDGGYK